MDKLNNQLDKTQKIHPQRNRKKLCLECNGYFANLAKHTRTHTGEKLYECNMCDTKFADNANYHRHINAHNIYNAHNSYRKLISYQSLVELEFLFGSSGTLNSFKK